MLTDKKITVLIAGGSGLIGKALTALLTGRGIDVILLSRKRNSASNIPSFQWDPSKGYLPKEALINVTHIVNLAGTPIAEKRWTEKVKKDILTSRLDSVATIRNAVMNYPSQIQALIGASAIGYYGDRNDELLTEESSPGNGFLSDTVARWEAAYNGSRIRTVLLRTGIVLSRKGGALLPLARPVELGIVPVTGNQFMSWIDIDDLCNMYLKAITDSQWSGIYNAVAPSPMRSREFMRMLQKVLNPVSLRIPVPGFFLTMLLGEQHHIITDSTNVSAGKIKATGFEFMYPDAESSIRHLYGR